MKKFWTLTILILNMISWSAFARELIPNIEKYKGTWIPVECEGAKQLSQRIDLIDQGKELQLTYLKKEGGEIKNISTKPETITKKHSQPGSWSELRQITERQIVGDRVVVAAIYYPTSKKEKGTAISTAMTQLYIDKSGNLIYERNGIGQSIDDGFYTYKSKCKYKKSRLKK
jgi:hypothetical protein